jgi:aspartyl-tRNA(Asn)/glutamyl-tRNA(Gln) amidotransferase subunit C
MILKEEIKKLADLARIDIEEGEQEKLASEMDDILNYVGQIKEMAGKKDFPSPEQGEGHAIAGGGVFNVLREDTDPTEPETHSQELIAEFPKSENNYLKVKKIL